jgi:hypothetical protein
MEFIQIILVIVLIMLAMLVFILIQLKYQEQINQSLMKIMKEINNSFNGLITSN